MELNPEQKRQLGRVYAYILSLAAKKKQAPVSQSLGDNEDTKVEKDMPRPGECWLGSARERGQAGIS